MDRETKKIIRNKGLGLICGKLQRDLAMMQEELFPICGIWHESDGPDSREIEAICAFSKNCLGRATETDGQARLAAGVDTVILYKNKGNWFIRRSSWPMKPVWTPVENLKNLRIIISLTPQ